MVEGKTLTTFRDIVLIVGMLVLCFFEMQAYTMRIQGRREQAVRFALARNAVAQLDDAYKKLLAGKPVNEQIFRQNENPHRVPENAADHRLRPGLRREHHGGTTPRQEAVRRDAGNHLPRALPFAYCVPGSHAK